MRWQCWTVQRTRCGDCGRCCYVILSATQSLTRLGALLTDFGYVVWRSETPIHNPINFYGCADDVFDGATALTVLAVPEEIDIAVSLVGWTRQQ